MHSISPLECSRIAQDLQIRKLQVENVAQLLDEGHTIPFIARYRRERTGGLREEVLRQIQTRVGFLRQLYDRKQTILKHIENQGRLTGEVRESIQQAETTRRLEDLYLPFKTKKRGLGAAAREKGLDPVARAVWHSDPAVNNLEELWATLVNPEKHLNTVDDVKAGVLHLLAELTTESASIRAPLRSWMWENSTICAVRGEKLPEGQGLEYKDYFQFTEPARHIPPHRILALNRGEKEQALHIRFEYDRAKAQELVLRALADHLLTEVGKTPPPAPTPKPLAKEAPAATVDPEPVPATGEAVPPDGEPGVAADASATESPPTPEAAPAPEQPAEAAPLEAAPLVESMAPQAPVVMTGEPLVPGGAFLSPHVTLLKTALDDALARLLLPSLEREIRHELTDEAEAHAVSVFARNLRSLLMQPPLRQRRVLAVDPSLRTGCKLAAIDENGNLIEHATVYPFSPPPQRRNRDKPAKPKAAAPAVAEATSPPDATPPPESVPNLDGLPVVDQVPEQAPTPPIEAPTASAETVETAVAEAIPAPSVESVTAPAPEAASETPAPEAAASAPAAEAVATPPQPEPDRKAETRGKIRDLVQRHNLHVIALGNGSGCREMEELLADLIASDLPDLAYVLVSEAGASVYALSPIAREELPNCDVALRSAISIGRRLQDPLSELVKVDPQHIGVGLYQHDMGRKELKESLDHVVESCVNQVGVDINSAGGALLRHVSGLNAMAAREIVEHRKQHGAFVSRAQLAELPAVGTHRALLSAGFLRVPAAPNLFDRTWLHPESYGVAEQLLGEMGATVATLEDPAAFAELDGKARALDLDATAQKLSVAPGTVEDMLDAILKPGEDPRDELPPPIFKKGILRIEDLQPGMELKGTVLNVVDFGAFVDVGLKDSGLVHISQLANRYIKSPYDVVAVHDVVTVWVLTLDKDRHRVSLTMIQPGSERRPQDRRPGPARRDEGGRQQDSNRQQDSGRPPRGRRPDGPPQQQGQSRPQGQGNEGGRGQRPQRGRPGQGQRGPQGAPAGGGSESGRNAPPPQRAPLPPPRPRREPPKPKLTQAALEGKVPLRTFSELSAMFAAKKEPPKLPEAPPAAETPAPPPEPAASTEAPPPPAVDDGPSIDSQP